MSRVKKLFSDVEEQLDDMRSTFSNKINNLYFSLQRPKIPSSKPVASFPSN